MWGINKKIGKLGVAKFEEYANTGQMVRENFRTIGGQQVTITTEDNVLLDGMYLDAGKFRQTLTDSGVGLITNFQNLGLPFSSGFVIQDDKQDTIQVLKGLHFFDKNANTGASSAGFVKVIVDHEVESSTIIVSQEEFANALRSKPGCIEFDISKQVYQWKGGVTGEFSTETIQPMTPPTGTIILDQGISGMYELNPGEALAFLMKGVNVMLFNHRGRGQSRGEVSVKGDEYDAEAVYQYIHRQHESDDAKIIVGGLCHGGQVMAQIAKKHPDVNLFLNQSYSAFEEAAKSLFGRLARVLVHRFGPHFNLEEPLKAVKGKVLLLVANKDRMVTQDQEDKKLDWLGANENNPNVSIGSIPGGHGASWINGENEKDEHYGGQYVDQFLSSLGMLHPILKKPTVPQRPPQQ